MSITPPIQSPIKTPLPTPVKDAQRATPEEIASQNSIINLLADIKIDTLTSPVNERPSFANSGVPKDTPQKPTSGKRKRDAIESEPEAEEVIKARAEYRATAQKAWQPIIEKRLTREQDRETIRKAIEACASPENTPHTRKISRKYPTEKSLEDAIKLMQFIQNSQGLSLNDNEKHHFLVRTLQDGTAGFCLTALKEFFGGDSKSSTTLVLDTRYNQFGLLRKIRMEIEGKSYCLFIPLKWTRQNQYSKNSTTLYPASIVPMDKQDTRRRFRNHSFKIIDNNKTEGPVRRHLQLQGLNKKASGSEKSETALQEKPRLDTLG